MEKRIDKQCELGTECTALYHHYTAAAVAGGSHSEVGGAPRIDFIRINQPIVRFGCLNPIYLNYKLITLVGVLKVCGAGRTTHTPSQG